MGVPISVPVFAFNLLGIYPDVELMDRMLILWSFWRTAILFSAEAEPFYFIPSMANNMAVYGSTPFFFSFWLHCTACGILVPQPGIKPAPPALEAQSLNHWTTREIPGSTPFCLSIYPLLDICVVSTAWLLWTVLLSIYVYPCFQFFGVYIYIYIYISRSIVVEPYANCTFML